MIFIFAFIGVMCLGIAPLFGKVALTGVNPMFAFAVRTIIAAILACIWLSYTGLNGYVKSLPISFWLAISIEALLAAFLGDLAYFYALQKGNISEVAIIMSCTPLITIIASFFFFDHSITLAQFLGAVLITSGLIVLSIE